MAKILTMNDGSQFNTETGEVIPKNSTNYNAYNPKADLTRPNLAEAESYAQIDAQGVKRDSQGNAIQSSVTFNPDGTRTVNQGSVVDNYWNGKNPNATAEQFAIDQAQTKRDYQQRMQDAINTVDNMYVSVISQANRKNENRLGSGNVINALSGQRGSASGAANIDTIMGANNADIKAIENEKSAKIAEIRGKYTKDLQDDLKYQNELRQTDTEAWLSYMGTKESENKLNSKAMRADLLKSNIKIEDISPDELQKMADAAGYSVDQFKLLYENERKAQEQAFADSEAEKLTKIETDKANLAKTNAEIEKLKSDSKNAGKDFQVVNGEIWAVDKTNGTAKKIGGEKEKKVPETKTVGNDLLQYNETTGGWDKIYSAPMDGKPLTVSEKLALAEKGYSLGTNNELVKIDTPDAKKIEKAGNLLSSIEDLQKMDWGKAVGPVSSNLPSWMSGEVNAIRAKINNIKAMLTIENMGIMKGVLSDSDMKVITSASTALDSSTDEKSFDQELLKIKEIAQKVINSSSSGKTKEQLKSEFPQATPEEIDALFKEESGFSQVGGDTNTAILKKTIAKADGDNGGQCGRFVNKLTGIGVGDSYQSKMSKMDKSIQYPEPGMVFTMPYKDTGHVGIIVGIEGDQAIVKDSNYGLDEKIKTHKIAINKMTGFARV